VNNIHVYLVNSVIILSPLAVVAKK